MGAAEALCDVGGVLVRAIRWHARRDVRLCELPPPRVSSPDDVLLRVLYCGICGTDLEEYRAGPRAVPRVPHPLTGRCAPITLGHEFAGEVVAVGPAVRGFAVGDLAAVEGNLYCGRCHWCEHSEWNLCAQLAQYGLAADGGLAELAVVRETTAVKLPSDADPRIGALAEPLSVAVRAARQSGATEASRVAIIGAGPIGLLVVQVMRSRGVASICVVEPMADRRRLALAVGAHEVADPAAADLVMLLASDGIGPDVVVECSGASGTARAAVEAVRRGGRVTFTAPVERAAIGPAFQLGEKGITSALSHCRDDYITALRLALTGEVDPIRVVTDEVCLEEAVQRAFGERLHQAPVGKMLVTPTGDAPGRRTASRSAGNLPELGQEPDVFPSHY
jgi:(R,R)-butanediol dehydrogenase/meso-butanediol dehydrogenase/diacetyl reductase